MPAPLPETVLHELSELWVSLGKQGQAESGTGVLRACSLTLVVLAETNEDTAALGETIAALMPEHPARTIMVWLEGESVKSLEARVQSKCWMPFGERRQICCEQIEITAPDAVLPDLAPFILPLTAPDLPVILWCRSARVAAMREFEEVAAIASKIVLDSARFSGAEAAQRRMAQAVERGHAVGDLAWTRLTPWRESLCRVFDNPKQLDRLPLVSSVRVAFGSGEETSARYLGAWLAAALQKAGAAPHLTIAPGPSLSAELSGKDIAVELAAREGKLTITLDGDSEYAALPPPGDYPAVREELAIVRRDAVFEKTLAAAAGLAYPTET